MYMRDIKVINVNEYFNPSYTVGAGDKFIYLNVHAGYSIIINTSIISSKYGNHRFGKFGVFEAIGKIL